MDLLNRISELEGECLKAIAVATTAEALQEVDLKYLSKKGLFSECMKSLRDVSSEDRPKVGARANEAKTRIDAALTAKRNAFADEALNAQLQSEAIDATLPALRRPPGSTHLITKVMGELVRIFQRLGFEIADGPEVETEFHNFDALNMLDDHPARDMQDTFFVGGVDGKTAKATNQTGVVLRTHTSPVQIRTMLAKKEPPVRILAPGAVFRSDYDVTHSPMFHQLEGLYVNKKVSFAELKGCLLFFAREYFGPNTQIRMRPSFFPFVEPGAEIDVSCVMCSGKGCRVCKETGWLEILGGGMVHPSVFKAAGMDSRLVQGFAFGMGIERIAMLKYGVPDLRLLFENDPRFLKQFGI